MNVSEIFVDVVDERGARKNSGHTSRWNDRMPRHAELGASLLLSRLLGFQMY